QGPAGPAGPAGPTGPTGVIKVLDFDAVWHPANLPGKNGNTIITPANCRTTNNPYTASAGDVAIVNVHGTATPSNPATDVLYINVMTSVNGGATFQVQTATDSAESMADGTANASVSKRINLVAGTTYIFGAGFSSNTAVAISTGYCEGTVMIVKPTL
ncbi:MAG TPA: hypothetical protein VK459_13830, partial [Polyangiaceae bacterium]|nr:hypothetical protein [Polyangiaceae bacterium]